MIVLHATAAPHDIPGLGIQRGETMYHLLSDQANDAGAVELLAFVRECGGHDSWMQSAGTYRAHFDIFGEWVERARALGAVEVSGREVALILARKREAHEADATIPVPTLTSRQMRAVDALMMQSLCVELRQMLELAGARLAEVARSLLGGSLQGKRIIVFAGPGNNGGGGLVAARHLSNAGARVTAHVLATTERLGDRHAGRLDTLAALGVPAQIGAVPSVSALAEADLLIDALLGYSISGPPRGMIATGITAMNAAGKPILALDLPSGLDPNELGPAYPCVMATATLTLGLPKRGLALVAAQPFVGDLWLADIGIPPRLLKRVGARVRSLFADGALQRLARRPLAGENLVSDVWQWVIPIA